MTGRRTRNSRWRYSDRPVAADSPIAWLSCVFSDFFGPALAPKVSRHSTLSIRKSGAATGFAQLAGPTTVKIGTASSLRSLAVVELGVLDSVRIWLRARSRTTAAAFCSALISVGDSPSPSASSCSSVAPALTASNPVNITSGSFDAGSSSAFS